MKGSVAESLHALCDRYNPAESEALIMFTLHGVPYSSNAAEIAQQILTEQWKNQVPADKLPALVSRITSRVVAVSTENNLPDKCSQFSNNVHIDL
jgi:type IV pilus biogenesis protein CpaD/CtpE